MATADEAGRWMWDELKKRGSLDQHEATSAIRDTSGGDLTYINNNGNLAISHDVLAAFKRHHSGRARWMGQRGRDLYWKLRDVPDVPKGERGEE